MTNTQLRIASAIVLTILFIIAFLVGKTGLFALLLITGALLIDEVMTKMLKVKRKHFNYIFSVCSFAGLLVYIQYIDYSFEYFEYLIHTGIVVNILFLIYLFLARMDSKHCLLLLKSNSYIIGFIFLTSISPILFIVNQENWTSLILLMFIVNFSVDTGAWFFGRKYGNRKIWPKISPKKTINGAIAGSLVSVICSSLFSYYALSKINLLIICSILALTVLAQLGDFFESKIKRQVGIKDSSNLIPGHGGIYDRIDSLVFIAPFYAIMVLKLY